MNKNDKDVIFNKLVSDVSKCDKCPRMDSRKKVLSLNNGNIHSKVIFIAEAPGRNGAEITGIPLYGDPSGNNFQELLNSINWKRNEIFITNSVLCNPQNVNGTNSSPTPDEIVNCHKYLKRILEIIDPVVVVTIGGKALRALKLIENHNFNLKDHAAKKLSWNNRYLFVLYHMSPRVINRYRNIKKQKGDFEKLKMIVHPINGIIK